MSRDGLVLQFGDSGPPALLAEWAAARDVGLTIHRADLAEPPAGLVDGHRWVAVLGSRFSPSDAGEPQVRRARAVVEEAVDGDVPVLGLCFGGQLLASVLGGEVQPAPRPELGWVTFDSADPGAVPPGPWLSWHWHRFTTPPGGTELARNDIGVQAFGHGRHLGVQFHPESTIEVVSVWAQKDGVADGRALLEQGRPHAQAATDAAYRLFDRFAATADPDGGETIHGAS